MKGGRQRSHVRTATARSALLIACLLVSSMMLAGTNMWVAMAARPVRPRGRRHSVVIAQPGRGQAPPPAPNHQREQLARQEELLRRDMLRQQQQQEQQKPQYRQRQQQSKSKKGNRQAAREAGARDKNLQHHDCNTHQIGSMLAAFDTLGFVQDRGFTGSSASPAKSGAAGVGTLYRVGTKDDSSEEWVVLQSAENIPRCLAMYRCAESLVCEGLVIDGIRTHLVTRQRSVPGHLPERALMEGTVLTPFELRASGRTFMAKLPHADLALLVKSHVYGRRSKNAFLRAHEARVPPLSEMAWQDLALDSAIGFSRLEVRDREHKPVSKAVPKVDESALKHHEAVKWREYGSGVIASFTTMPNRVKTIGSTLRSLLAQTVALDKIYVVLPKKAVRTGEPYHVPEWLTEFHPRVEVLQPDKDYGPATKLIPVVQLMKDQGRHDQRILVADDDTIYPPQLVENFLAWSRRIPNAAMGFRGWRVNPDKLFYPNIRHVRFGHLVAAPTPLHVLTANCGYFIQPKFFSPSLWDYSNCKECFFMDDPWISGQLAKQHVPRMVVPVDGLCAAVPEVAGESTLSENIGSLHRVETNSLILKQFKGHWERLPNSETLTAAAIRRPRRGAKKRAAAKNRQPGNAGVRAPRGAAGQSGAAEPAGIRVRSQRRRQAPRGRRRARVGRPGAGV